MVFVRYQPPEPELRVQIVRWVTDDPQPGIVECEFHDANGAVQRFMAKSAIVSADWLFLGADGMYPYPGAHFCEIVQRFQDERLGQLMKIRVEAISPITEVLEDMEFIVSADEVNEPGPMEDAFHQLCFYTLAHGSSEFIHQYVVDAFAAQTATATDKPIKLAFALIGLYFHIEKGYSGREVQRAHMKLAEHRKQWPTFAIPTARGDVTVHDVLAAPAGPDRDAAIERWCRSVWNAWSSAHSEVARLATAV